MKKTIVVILFFIILPSVSLAQTSFSVNFGFNSDTLTKEMQAVLDKEISPIYKSARKYQVSLSGHTDSIGSKEFNQELSRRRCQTVANYFKEKGLIVKDLSYNNFSKPLSENTSEKGRASNRRVEILVMPIDKTVLEIPSEEFKFQTQKGGTFFFQRSGTLIQIPQNAMMDKNGKAVEGEVVLRYREFRHAADFIASGIPMVYDSAGSSYLFNSGGMFEIRAFQGKEELRLQKGKNIHMGFILTDTLPDLNFYQLDEQGNNWVFKHDLSQRAQKPPIQNNKEYGAENLQMDQDQDLMDCAAYFDLSCNPDTCEGIRQAIETGLEYAFSKETVMPTLEVDYLSFDKRFISHNYSGIYLNKNQTINDQFYPIYFEKVKKKGGKTAFYIKDKIGEHSEISILKDIAWNLGQKAMATWKDSLFIKRWSDMRMVKLQPDGSIVFEFKDYRNHEIILHPIYLKERISKKQLPERSQTLMNDFANKLQLRRLAVNDSIQNNNNTVERGRYYERNQCFYNYSKLFADGFNLCMTMDQWFIYFNNQKQVQMQKKFTDLKEEFKDTGQAKCSTLVHDKLRELRKMKWLANGSHQQTINFDETEEHRLERVKYDETGLRQLAEMVIQWQGNKNLDAGHVFPKMIQELFITGFGIYNADQIQLLGNLIQIRADYKDQNGKPIKGRVLSMVDKNINGAMSFDPKLISFNPKSRNAFVLFDAADNKYILREEDLNKLNLTSSQAFTFTLENITEKVKTAAELKKELGLE